MKNLFYLLAVLLSIPTAGIAQKIKEKADPDYQCFFDHRLSEEKKDHGFNLRLEDIERQVFEYKKRSSFARTGPNDNIVIPVVVTVINTGSNQPENISDNQIATQISVLNQQFQNFGIRFCIARRDAVGTITGATPGIFRITNTALSNFDITTEESLLTTPSGYILPNYRYLKIYVVKSISGPVTDGVIQGYSSFPGFTSVFDGIVIRADTFGNSADPLCTACYLNPQFNQGTILTHEIGHYFGLYHTFEMGCNEIYHNNDCANLGDRVCDTPPVAVKNTGCPININSCNEANDLPDNINNYMDYTNQSCRNNFTDGQVDRMFAMLAMYRSELISQSNLITADACMPAGISATFTSSTNAPCANATVVFTASNNTSGSTYYWDFGDGSTSTLQNPSHVFSPTGSAYNVTLTVTNGAQYLTSTQQIFSSNCTPILNTDTNWFLSWRNALSFQTGVPLQTPVTITPQSENFAELAAAQSNSSGQLLFFTNGQRVFNASQIQINPVALKGNISSYDGVLIIPNPANANEFYILSKDATTYNSSGIRIPGSEGFRYHKVQVSGTTASLTTSNTNIAITTNPTNYLVGNDGAVLGSEGIAAVQHCSGYWVITGMLKTTGFFVAVYNLNSSGAIVHHSEFSLPITGQFGPYQSSLKASPDGNKLVLCGLNVPYFLLDFNKYTGVVSNPIDLSISGRGACFSPDSKLLYISGIPQFTETDIYQYNLDAINIVSGRKIISTVSTDTGQMQNGPDGKIYMSRWAGRMGVIHYPNVLSTASNPNACGFSPYGPSLQNSGQYGNMNLINAKITTAYNNTITMHPTGCLSYQFFANTCGSTFSWNFGDPSSGANTASTANASHTFSGPGTYTVTLTTASLTLTKQVTISNPSVEVLGNNVACVEDPNNATNHSITLPDGGSVIWTVSGGSIVSANNRSDVTVHWTSLPGTITATVTAAGGCATSSSVQVLSQCYAPCTNSLTLSNQQQSGNQVFRVAADITTNQNYLVENLQTTELIAGNSIQLNPNSYVTPGSQFTAKIEPCSWSRVQDTNNGKTLNEASILIISPNPTTGILNITGTPVTEVTVYDLIGNIVFKRNIYKESESSIDISLLSQGVYLLRASLENDKTETVKIIKN